MANKHTAIAIGGKLHGQLLCSSEHRVYCQHRKPQNYYVRPPALSSNLLELREIEALTGRKSHHTNEDAMRYEMLTKQALLTEYELRAYVYCGVRHEFFVYTGLESKEADDLIYERLSGVTP